MAITPIIQPSAAAASAAFERQAGSGSKRRATDARGGSTPLDQAADQQNDRVELSGQDQSGESPFQNTGLSEVEQQELRELQQRNREVRTHEQAHRAAGGAFVRGAATYEFQRGPDGQLYAVGGEVSVDTSEVTGDPEATIRKMQTVRRAALAPSQPSPQDRRVAAEAARREAKARAELNDERLQEARDIVKQRSGNASGSAAQAANPAEPFLANQKQAETPNPGSFLELLA